MKDIGPIWYCKIGIVNGKLPNVPIGSDLPMRDTIRRTYAIITGLQPEFIFSGWSAELTPGELAVVNPPPIVTPAEAEREAQRSLDRIRKLRSS